MTVYRDKSRSSHAAERSKASDGRDRSKARRDPKYSERDGRRDERDKILYVPVRENDVRDLLQDDAAERSKSSKRVEPPRPHNVEYRPRSSKRTRDWVRDQGRSPAEEPEK